MIPAFKNAERGLTLRRETSTLTNRCFFGFHFSEQGLLSNSSKIDILALDNPRDASEVRSLLGMINYKIRATIFPYHCTSTDTQMADNDEPIKWDWTTEQEEAFDRLKRSASDGYFDPHKKTQIIVGAKHWVCLPFSLNTQTHLNMAMLSSVLNRDTRKLTVKVWL